MGLEIGALLLEVNVAGYVKNHKKRHTFFDPPTPLLEIYSTEIVGHVDKDIHKNKNFHQGVI